MSRDEEALRNLFEKGESANQDEEGQSLEQEESVQEEEEENKEIDGDEKATSSDEEDIDIEKLASERVSEQDMEVIKIILLISLQSNKEKWLMMDQLLLGTT